MEKQVTKEVSATLGYELPLSEDTYSKEKASAYLKVVIGGEDIDRKLYQKEAREMTKELVEDAKDILKEGWVDVAQEIERLKNTRNDAIDELRIEIEKEYEEKLKKAKEMILDQREEIKLLKNK